MYLNAAVEFEQPLASLFHRLLRRSIDGGFQVGVCGQFDYELTRQCGIQRIEQARIAPFRRQSVQVRCCHGFTIQLATSLVKRAATAVRPPLYCTATTQASVSSVPSEFRKRNLSANSSGNVEENSTSRGVPNSMMVLSVPVPVSLATRVSRTGMRTGVALGKNFASLVVELSRAGAAAAPDLDTLCLIPASQGSMRPGFPSPPVSATRTPGPHRERRMHDSGQSGETVGMTVYQGDRWFRSCRSS